MHIEHDMKCCLVLPTLFLLPFWVSAQSQCSGCDCFKVYTMSLKLEELVSKSPLFSQAASVSSQGLSLDSVCLSLSETNTPDNVLVEMINTVSNGSVSRRASIQTTDKPGIFNITGPTRAYKDFILGRPCRDTYVVYRCVQTGTCVTDVNKVDVFVTSSRIRQHKKCIDKGKEIAQQNFPGLQFYDLPRTVTDPCYSCSSK